MASSNPLFPEGNSIHRPPIFNGEGYHYWKTHMQIFIEAIDLNIWEAIEIGPYIPIVVDVSTSTLTQKPIDKWTEEDRRRIKKEQLNLQGKSSSKLCTKTFNLRPCLDKLFYKHFIVEENKKET